MSNRKPVVTAVDNPFGTFSEELMNGDTDLNKTPWFIKGYSDVRQRRDAAFAKGETPPMLNGRFQWVRGLNSKDGPDKKKIAQRKAEGYTVVQWDETRKLGIDLEGSAAAKAADGSVVMSEYVLMYCPKEKAARNLARLQQINDGQLANSLARTESVAGMVSQMAPQIEEPAAKK